MITMFFSPLRFFLNESEYNSINNFLLGSVMNKERIVLISHWIICIIGAVLIGLVGIKVILPLVFPFLIAWAVAFAVRPLAEKLHKLIRLPSRLIRPVLAVLIIVTLIGLFCFLAFRIAAEAWQLLSGIGENKNLVGFLTSLLNPLHSIFGENGLPKELGEKLAAALGVTPTYLTGWEEERPHTLAAHFEGEEFSEDELREIEKFVQFVKSRRNQ